MHRTDSRWRGSASPRVAAAIALGALAIGCSRGVQAPAADIRDSLGIRIVTNGRGMQPAPWTVAERPTLIIGAVDAPEPVFLLSRVAAAYRLTNGNIVVADGMSAEFRFFDSGGGHINTTAGKGGGPGELRVLFSVTLLDGDTLLAFDPALERLDWFGPSGEFIRRSRVATRSAVAPPLFNEGAQYLSDHTVLLRAYRSGSGPLNEIFRPAVALLRIDADTVVSSIRDTVGWFGAVENFAISVGGRRVGGSAPFYRRLFETSSHEQIIVVDSDRYEVQTLSLTDGRRQLIRRVADPVPATAADREELIEQYRAFAAQRDPSRRANRERWLAAAPFRVTKPPVSAVTSDRAGNIWVQETPPAGASTATWAVFHTDGRLVAEVRLPSRLNPLDVGDDYLLGLWRDESDVEYVHLYALSKDSVGG